jgi:hypothetical protein
MSKKFSPHIELAHHYWSSFLNKGDCAIDATLGNGYDLLFLAKLTLEKDKGYLYAFDIQKEALEASQNLLKENLPPKFLERINLQLASHCHFTNIKHAVKLVVYNLGYLPKGNKEITTKVESTLKSVLDALDLVANHGAVSITCYPGHPEGKKEEAALLAFLEKLASTHWEVCYHKWLNAALAPSLIWIKRKQKNEF